jgi:hypothetical protein
MNEYCLMLRKQTAITKRLMKPICGSLYIVLSGIVLMFSCKEDDYCTLPLIAEVNIGFYTLEDDELTNKQIYRFSAIGTSADTFYYDSLANASQIALPLSNTKDTTEYIFTFTEVEYYTIEIPDKSALFSRNEKPTRRSSQGIAIHSDWMELSADSIVTDTVTTIDTLQFIYVRQLFFLSYACGYINNYSIQELISSENRIDSIAVINSYITTSDEENVQILF